MISLSQKSVCRREQTHEFVVFDFSRSILVYVLNQFFNVYSHLELVLDNLNQPCCVNESVPVWLATQRHKRIQSVFLVGGPLELFLFCNNLLELLLAYLARIFGTSLCYHAINFLIWRLLPHHFKHNAQFSRINKPRRIFVKGAESLLAFALFVGGKSVRVFLIILASCTFCHLEKSNRFWRWWVVCWLGWGFVDNERFQLLVTAIDIQQN